MESYVIHRAHSGPWPLSVRCGGEQGLAQHLIPARAPRRDARSGGRSLSTQAQRARSGSYPVYPTPGGSHSLGEWLAQNPMEAMEAHAGQIIRAAPR